MITLLKWTAKLILGLLSVVGQAIYDAMCEPSASEDGYEAVPMGSGRTMLGTVEPIETVNGEDVGAYSGSYISNRC